MWQYKEKELTDSDIPETAIGFLYKITHITTGNWYVGKKLLTKAAYKQVNGKRKKLRKESDWKDYWSSSPQLKEIIDAEGTANFKRDVLMFVDTKASFTYGEEALLYMTGALFDAKCYNGNIRSKVQRNWFNKTPDLHKNLLKVWGEKF